VPAKKSIPKQIIEPAPAPVEEKDFEIIEEQNSEPATIHDDLAAWITENGFTEESKKCTLYKFDNNKAGDRKQFCETWIDEFPELKDIGLLFGGGRYMLYVNIQCDIKRKGTTRSYKFRIHEEYDRLKREHLKSIIPQTVQQPGGNILETMAIFRELISTIAPLMKPNESSINNSINQTRLLQDVIKESTMNNVAFARDLMNRSLNGSEPVRGDLPDEPEEMPEPEQNWMLQILPLIDKYLPLIIGEKPEAKMLTGLVKSAPQFKQLIKNRSHVNELLKYIKGKFGADECLQACKILGIKK
jgi:hypothetical protein